LLSSLFVRPQGNPGMATGEQPVAASSEPATTTPNSEQITTSPGAPSPTGIQAASEGERIPLPPPTVPPAGVPESVMRRVHVLEGFLVLLLLALAFLLGSFRATNSDLLLHLATGRMIATGNFTFGQDPFTFTSSGTWVNHAWLFDLIAYLIYM